MRKAALTCATLAALLLIAVLGLGFYGQSSSAQTKNELAEETEIAHELLQVKQAAEAQNADKLVNLTNKKLAQLPASSRELAAENSDSAQPLTEALTSSSNNLLETAYSTDDPQLRVFLLDISLQLWDAGVEAKTVEGEYPTAVADRVAALNVCELAESPAEAPASLAAVMTGLDELTYAASLFNARADIDGYSESEAAIVSKTNDEVTALRTRANYVLYCTYQLPTRQASYPVNAKDPQATLNTLKGSVKDAVQAALADPAVSNEQALTELLVLQKSFK